MVCYIISGSPNPNIEILSRYANRKAYVITADAGYLYAKKAGLSVDLAVGDFDTMQGQLPLDCEVIALTPDKDYTDTLCCVRIAIERGYRTIMILNAMGGRTDHLLANLHALEYAREHGAEAMIQNGLENIELLLAGQTQYYHHMEGFTFSVIPIGCEEAEASYEGARYPMEHGVLKSGLPIGISNVFTGCISTVTVHRGKALVFTELFRNKEEESEMF